MILKVKKLNNEAFLPFKATKGSLGYDLYTYKDTQLEPYIPALIETGIALEIPKGFGVEIRDRSSMGLKGVKYLGGEVDNDYRGEIKVILINLTKTLITLKKGDRIAQFIPKRIHEFIIKEVTELSKTKRGSGGFGSTNNLNKNTN